MIPCALQSMTRIICCSRKHKTVWEKAGCPDTLLLTRRECTNLSSFPPQKCAVDKPGILPGLALTRAWMFREDDRMRFLISLPGWAPLWIEKRINPTQSCNCTAVHSLLDHHEVPKTPIVRIKHLKKQLKYREQRHREDVNYFLSLCLRLPFSTKGKLHPWTRITVTFGFRWCFSFCLLRPNDCPCC